MCPWILLDNENDDYNDENKCKENYFIWFQVSIHKTGTRIINQLIDIIYLFKFELFKIIKKTNNDYDYCFCRV